MSRIYLADKPTLDKVDATTADTKGKVGTTVDVGGSTSAGSVFGKLNAVIAYLLGYVTTSLTNIGNYTKRLNDLWPDARVAKVDLPDAAISSWESEANANARYNNILNWLKPGGRVRVSKVVNITKTAPGNYTLLDIAGPGSFDFSNTNMGFPNGPLIFEADGQVVARFSNITGHSYICNSMLSAGDYLAATPTNNSQALTTGEARPLYFKNSFKVTLNLAANLECFFRADYTVHE